MSRAFTMVHEGANYRITCSECDYDKVSSTEWGANCAVRSHENSGIRHNCVVESLGDDDE